ncbi:hypothetical protein C8F01DRAFT_1084448 [Mycena amicta]|nr:hypothetical protein C8F01DRAFT_1084448 [Mycena amicta]
MTKLIIRHEPLKSPMRALPTRRLSWEVIGTARRVNGGLSGSECGSEGGSYAEQRVRSNARTPNAEQGSYTDIVLGRQEDTGNAAASKDINRHAPVSLSRPRSIPPPSCALVVDTFRPIALLGRTGFMIVRSERRSIRRGGVVTVRQGQNNAPMPTSALNRCIYPPYHSPPPPHPTRYVHDGPPVSSIGLASVEVEGRERMGIVRSTKAGMREKTDTHKGGVRTEQEKRQRGPRAPFRVADSEASEGNGVESTIGGNGGRKRGVRVSLEKAKSDEQRQTLANEPAMLPVIMSVRVSRVPPDPPCMYPDGGMMSRSRRKGGAPRWPKERRKGWFAFVKARIVFESVQRSPEDQVFLRRERCPVLCNVVRGRSKASFLFGKPRKKKKLIFLIQNRTTVKW